MKVCCSIKKPDPSENDVSVRAHTVPGEKPYVGTVTSCSTTNGTTENVIFSGDSIFRGGGVWNFNQHVKMVLKKQFKVSPDCDSKKMLYYVKTSLEIGCYNTAIVHAEVNELLMINRQVTSNLVNIVKNCQSLCVKNLFFSGITLIKGCHIHLLRRPTKELKICVKIIK